MKRREAIAAGLTWYDDGKMCPYGHTRGRWVHSGCVECHRIKVNRKRLEKRGCQSKVSLHPRIMARVNGESTYLSDKPCRRGHRSPRRVDNAECIECIKLRQQSVPRLISDRLKLDRTGRIISEEAREKRREKARRYKARKRSRGGIRITPELVLDLSVRQRGKCAICLTKISGKDRVEVDHIVPLIDGGLDDLSNFQLTHAECNRSKGRKDPIVHAQQVLGRLL